MNRTQLIFVSWISAVLCAAGIAAQSSPDQQQMASQLRQNQEELQSYSWKSKYTYTVDGVQKRVEEYSVKYFSDGTHQKRQISSQVDKEKVHRADGKKFSKKEREAAYTFVTEVKGQLDAYMNPFFAEKGVASATITTSGDTLILKAHDVVTTGDSVEIRYLLENRQPKSAAITTTVEGSPVSLEVEFGTLEVGPNYPARSVTKATWQGLKLVIAAENGSYERARR